MFASVSLDAIWGGVAQRIRDDQRTFIVAMVRLPGADLTPLKDPAVVRGVVDAAVASDNFPIGPFAYVDAPIHLEVGENPIGGSLVYDTPKSYLEGHFGFGQQGDVAAGWAFTRARPGTVCADVALVDMEAVLAETFVMAARVAEAVGHEGECRLMVGVMKGQAAQRLHLQAIDEDTGELVTSPIAPAHFIPVQTVCPNSKDPSAIREAQYDGATKLARQFGVAAPQFLTAVESAQAEPLTSALPVLVGATGSVA